MTASRWPRQHPDSLPTVIALTDTCQPVGSSSSSTARNLQRCSQEVLHRWLHSSAGAGSKTASYWRLRRRTPAPASQRSLQWRCRHRARSPQLPVHSLRRPGHSHQPRQSSPRWHSSRRSCPRYWRTLRRWQRRTRRRGRWPQSGRHPELVLRSSAAGGWRASGALPGRPRKRTLMVHGGRCGCRR